MCVRWRVCRGTEMIMVINKTTVCTEYCYWSKIALAVSLSRFRGIDSV